MTEVRRKLSELLPGTDLPVDATVSGITDNSRDVVPGSLFVAVPGLANDGRAFIGDAIARHAAAIFCEPPVPAGDFPVPVIEVSGLAALRGEIAARFFGAPSAAMLVIAVTGTNGKTSCTQFIASALCSAGKKCGIIGTLGYGLPGGMQGAGLTTPDAIGLQRRLAALREMACECVSLEASSHGLAQDRLAGTAIDVGVFTNITRDHLDYHETFADYKRAKQRLFEWPGLSAAVINLDDPFAAELVRSVDEKTKVLTYSMVDHAADVCAKSIAWRSDGFDMQVATPWGAGTVSSKLLGDFNASNVLAVISVLGFMEFGLDEVLALVSGLEKVPGRMDVMRRAGMPLVVIDYAHTPDALEKALAALRRHVAGKLWCVVGCGGDRDAGKRPLMGKIASTLADAAVITDDNPRSEPSGQIIAQIVAGADKSRILVEPDRAAAIALAIGEASEDDLVLIAGKGHEDYQEVSGKRVPFSDFAEVERIFGQAC